MSKERVNNNDYALVLSFESDPMFKGGANHWHSWRTVADRFAAAAEDWGWEGDVGFRFKAANADPPVQVGDRFLQAIPVTVEWDLDEDIDNNIEEWDGWDDIMNAVNRDPVFSKLWVGNVRWVASMQLVRVNGSARTIRTRPTKSASTVREPDPDLV